MANSRGKSYSGFALPPATVLFGIEAGSTELPDKGLVDALFKTLQVLRENGIVPSPRFSEMSESQLRLCKTEYKRAKGALLHMKLILHIDGYLSTVGLGLDLNWLSQPIKNIGTVPILRHQFKMLYGANPPRFARRACPKQHKDKMTVAQCGVYASLELNWLLAKDPTDKGLDFSPPIGEIPIFEILGVVEPDLASRRLVTKYESDQVRIRLGYRPKGTPVTLQEYHQVQRSVNIASFVRDKILHGVISSLLNYRERRIDPEVHAHLFYELFVRTSRYIGYLDDPDYVWVTDPVKDQEPTRPGFKKETFEPMVGSLADHIRSLDQGSSSPKGDVPATEVGTGPTETWALLERDNVRLSDRIRDRPREPRMEPSEIRTLMHAGQDVTKEILLYARKFGKLPVDALGATPSKGFRGILETESNKLDIGSLDLTIEEANEASLALTFSSIEEKMREGKSLRASEAIILYELYETIKDLDPSERHSIMKLYTREARDRLRSLGLSIDLVEIIRTKENCSDFIKTIKRLGG